jgi:hypothetical protein
MKSKSCLHDLCQSLRIALTGTTVTEPIGELLAIMGKDVVVKKLEIAMAHTEYEMWDWQI